MKKDAQEISAVERRIIYELGGDLSDGARPFADLGKKVGLSEAETVAAIQGLNARGLLRRFGATLRHQRTGFKANAMVAWKVPDDQIETAGRTLAEFPEVTHCYQRKTVPGWDRNLYTMIHAASDEDCYALAEKMAQKAGLNDYELLFSHEELKKTSMRYFR